VRHGEHDQSVFDQKHCSFEDAVAVDENAWKRHQLPAFAKAIGLPLSDELKLLLRNEAFAVGPGVIQSR
jgi:hypothetical protein